MYKKDVFSPLYISNFCDAKCKMCNLNSDNKKTIRNELNLDQIKLELKTLFDNGIKGVSFLTGEYYEKDNRQRMITLVKDSCQLAKEMGFTNIIINIGSLTEDEVLEFKSLNFPLTIALFMETYNQAVYEKWMGNKVGKGNFQQRLNTYDYWIKHNLGPCNFGILVGLNPNIKEDVRDMLEHVKRTNIDPKDVFLSLPKMIQTHQLDEYKDIFRKLKDYKLILTNRENEDTILELLPYIHSFSPGIPRVGAYYHKLDSTNQFKINFELMPWEILNRLKIIPT